MPSAPSAPASPPAKGTLPARSGMIAGRARRFNESRAFPVTADFAARREATSHVRPISLGRSHGIPDPASGRCSCSWWADCVAGCANSTSTLRRLEERLSNFDCCRQRRGRRPSGSPAPAPCSTRQPTGRFRRLRERGTPPAAQPAACFARSRDQVRGNAAAAGTPPEPGLGSGHRGPEAGARTRSPSTGEPTARVTRLRPSDYGDFERRFGTQWVVWVGGLALALGGIFLVRYSIEAGLFTPGLRIIFGALLAAVSGRPRRTGAPPRRSSPASRRSNQRAHPEHPRPPPAPPSPMPTSRAAYALYGFAPPVAFVLLGVVALAHAGRGAPARPGARRRRPGRRLCHADPGRRRTSRITGRSISISRSSPPRPMRWRASGMWRWLAITAAVFSLLWMLVGLGDPLGGSLSRIAFYAIVGYRRSPRPSSSRDCFTDRRPSGDASTRVSVRCWPAICSAPSCWSCNDTTASTVADLALRADARRRSRAYGAAKPPILRGAGRGIAVGVLVVAHWAD